MNSRERLLLMIVGVSLALLAAWGAKGYYTRKTGELADQYRYEQRKLEEARQKLRQAKEKEQEWRQLGRQTLSMDPLVAKGVFRTELVNLAGRVGLPVPQPTDVTPGSPRFPGGDGVQILLCTVKTEGTLPQLVRFLFELYREPYIVRCKSVRLEPVMSKPATPNAEPTLTGSLRLTVYVETPILPSDKRVPKLETAQLEPGKRVPVSRPLLDIADAYAGAIKQDLFKPYVMEIARKTSEERTTTGPSKDNGDKGPEEQPRKPADAELVLARVLSSPRIQQVVLEDPKNRNVPDRRVQVGEPLYLGRLIYIDRTGAVSKSDEDGTLLFHSLGLTLERGQILSATEHPAVFEALAAKDGQAANRTSRSTIGCQESAPGAGSALSRLPLTDASSGLPAGVVAMYRSNLLWN